MSQFMTQVREKVMCGLVGGSDLKKIAEQMGGMEGELLSDGYINTGCIVLGILLIMHEKR